mmetsp:Transcript_11355/g.40273  ORF Transcript_11355/g.40273 Transcript_11355/m.40273 type:complete len:486 (-) Transcript_11355:291-1748(-)
MEPQQPLHWHHTLRQTHLLGVLDCALRRQRRPPLGLDPGDLVRLGLRFDKVGVHVQQHPHALHEGRLFCLCGVAVVAQVGQPNLEQAFHEGLETKDVGLRQWDPVGRRGQEDRVLHLIEQVLHFARLLHLFQNARELRARDDTILVRVQKLEGRVDRDCRRRLRAHAQLHHPGRHPGQLLLGHLAVFVDIDLVEKLVRRPISILQQGPQATEENGRLGLWPGHLVKILQEDVRGPVSVLPLLVHARERHSENVELDLQRPLLLHLHGRRRGRHDQSHELHDVLRAGRIVQAHEVDAYLQIVQGDNARIILVQQAEQVTHLQLPKFHPLAHGPERAGGLQLRGTHRGEVLRQPSQVVLDPLAKEQEAVYSRYLGTSRRAPPLLPPARRRRARAALRGAPDKLTAATAQSLDLHPSLSRFVEPLNRLEVGNGREQAKFVANAQESDKGHVSIRPIYWHVAVRGEDFPKHIAELGDVLQQLRLHHLRL